MALASQVNTLPGPSLNPLRCDGTALPVPVLLMAKVMAVALLLTGEWYAMPDIFLPHFSFLDSVPAGHAFHMVLEIAIIISAIALLLNLWVRPACLIIGSSYLLANLASQPYFTNSRLFTGCLFFVIGLCSEGQEPWLIWCQVALLYFGGALNKLLEADWRSGRFFDYWGRIYVDQKLFLWSVSWLPWSQVALALSWVTIFIEIILLVGFLFRRFRGWAIWLGLLFHGSTIFLTGRPFGFFMFALPASYLAFVAWPSCLTVLYDGQSVLCDRVRDFFDRFEFNESMVWTPYQTQKQLPGISEEALQKRIHVLVDGKRFSGFAAFQRLLLYNPATYLALSAVLSICELFAAQRWLVFPLLVVFSPVATPIGDTVFDWVARNQRLFDRRRLSQEAELKSSGFMGRGKSAVARVAGLLLAAFFLCAAGGFLFESIVRNRDALRYPMKGHLIDVGGYRLLLNCTGSGSPTVVLDSGIMDSSQEWKDIQPILATRTRVCSYDRAGLGRSDPSPHPRTSFWMAQEMHTVLANGNIEGPYVLVGHSFGGLNAIVFAAEHPQETAGVVLVDSINPSRVSAPTVLKNELIMWLYGTAAPFGLPRLLGHCPIGPLSCRQYAKTFAAMREARLESAQIAHSVVSLGDLPLIVIARDPQHYLHSDKSLETREREESWSASQEDLLRLSTDATLMIAGRAGHSIPQENPQVVIDAVESMTQSIRLTLLQNLALARVRAQSGLQLYKSVSGVHTLLTKAGTTSMNASDVP